jgi:hypothetical protein
MFRTSRHFLYEYVNNDEDKYNPIKMKEVVATFKEYL